MRSCPGHWAQDQRAASERPRAAHVHGSGTGQSGRPSAAARAQATAATAALYKRQTKEVERSNAAALGAMVGVASQAFSAITTVRCGRAYPNLNPALGAMVGVAS